jgi:hypothetical protein
MGIIFSDPTQFPILVILSLSSVSISNFLFFLFFRKERIEEKMNGVGTLNGVEMESFERDDEEEGGEREKREKEEECEI